MKVKATRPEYTFTVTVELTQEEYELIWAQRMAMYGKGIFGHFDSSPQYETAYRLLLGVGQACAQAINRRDGKGERDFDEDERWDQANAMQRTR